MLRMHKRENKTMQKMKTQNISKKSFAGTIYIYNVNRAFKDDKNTYPRIFQVFE